MYFVRTTYNLEHVLQQAPYGADQAHPDKRTDNGVCDQPVIPVPTSVPTTPPCGVGCGATIEVLVSNTPVPTAEATVVPTEVPTATAQPTPTMQPTEEEEVPTEAPVPTVAPPTRTPVPQDIIIPQQPAPLPSCDTGSVPCGSK